jgi:hypothetical protein
LLVFFWEGFVAVEPPILVHVRSIRVPVIFRCATLTLLLQKGGGGVGNAVLPLFGRVSTISGELLEGEFECEPVLRSLGVG